jgi:endonuclease YncB( thermonuclease family)
MKKLLIMLVLLCPLVSLAKDFKGISYDWKILRVIDGDTVMVAAEFLPPPLKPELSIRIFGIDTPEKGARARCRKEEERSRAATDFVVRTIEKSQRQEVVVMEWDKYGGRVLGDILVDGRSIRQLLIANNYAREYYGGTKKSWCR